MDGKVTVKRSDGSDLVLRDHVQTTCAGSNSGTCALTGYTPYWTDPY